MLSLLKEYLPTIRKAVVGFIVAFVVSFLSRNGLELDQTAMDGLRAFIDAVAVGLSVWLVRNR